MEQHVKIIGILDIVFGALGVLGGLFFMIMFLFFAPMIGASGEEGAAAGAAIFASVGLAGGIVIIGMSAFEIIVGLKLQAHKPWARVVQIILGVLALPGFPVGTALGAYYLWAMLNKDTAVLFE